MTVFKLFKHYVVGIMSSLRPSPTKVGDASPTAPERAVRASLDQAVKKKKTRTKKKNKSNQLH